MVVKCEYRRFQKYLIWTNFFISPDICFVINNLYYNNINFKLPLYNLLKQKKKNSKLLEKRLSKIVNQKNIANNILIRSKMMVLIKLLKRFFSLSRPIITLTRILY